MDATDYAGLSPYLCVRGGAAAIDFYKQAFAAEETERYEHEGKVGHASLRINGCDLMLADEYPDNIATVGMLAPPSFGGTTSTINLSVDDVDAWFSRATAAGAEQLLAPVDQFYGRHGKLRDPFGHVWSITGPKKG